MCFLNSFGHSHTFHYGKSSYSLVTVLSSKIDLYRGDRFRLCKGTGIIVNKHNCKTGHYGWIKGKKKSLWGRSDTATGWSERDCGVSVLGYIQNLTGKGHEQCDPTSKLVLFRVGQTIWPLAIFFSAVLWLHNEPAALNSRGTLTAFFEMKYHEICSLNIVLCTSTSHPFLYFSCTLSFCEA